MKLHLEIQIKVHCPIVQNHFQPVSALCFGWCNYCVLMRVIIDCWSQQMKINSLCIMTFPIRLTHLCFRAHCCHPALRPPPHYLTFCTSCISQSLSRIRTPLMFSHCSGRTQPQRFLLNSLIFILDPKDKNMAVRMGPLAWHVNQLECSVFIDALLPSALKYTLVRE